jgi:hypothetical protein
MAGLILNALLAHSIDYAGLFPPASLPLEQAVANFLEYRRTEFAWMLGRFVVAEKNLDAMPAELDGSLAVLSEHDTARASVIETKSVVSTSLPAYCEVPVSKLEAVSNSGKFAKVRTGGLTPDSILSTAALAEFIVACARLHLPFKATAGLHHPIRAEMHGFINFLAASSVAWNGGPFETVCDILDETDASAFRWNESLHWRDYVISVDDAAEVRRRFAHSFGSCSLSEPLEGLQQLGWL